MAIAHPMASRPRDESRLEFRLIYAVAFAYFLAIAFAVRCLPRSWRPILPGFKVSGSIFSEARQTAGSLVPFAFMH